LPGHFRFDITPYLRPILDACANPAVRRVVCRKSSQIGWTDGVVLNLIGYRIDSNPSRILVLFPREKTAIDFNDEKLEPMIESVAGLASKVNLKSRAAGNRQLFKRYPGGFAKLIASNAPGDVKSTSAPLVIVEEPDDCNQNVKGQGDSIKLAEERAKSYHNSLIVIGGTPTIKGVSAIDEEMKKTDSQKWFVPCHDCGESHVLAWENVHWTKDEASPHPVHGKHHPETAYYTCPHCGSVWNDAQKAANIRRGGYVATAAFTGAMGFDDLNELYSPFPNSTMPHIVAKFLEASREFKAGKAEKLIAFWNSSLGRSYEYKSELPAIADLEQRAEAYAEGTVPMGGLVLKMGVDVQHNRLAIAIWAYGRDMESWLVFWGEEYGATSSGDDPVWKSIDSYVDRIYPHASGAEAFVESVSIDSSDGQTSDAVYDWVRRRRRGRCKVMAVKGSSSAGTEIYVAPAVRSIDPGAGSKASKYGVKVHMVGTEKAKDLILGYTADGGRIKRCDRAADGSIATGRGAGRMHWYRGVRHDFYEQLADSEVKVPNNKVSGRLAWTLKAGRHNEALDCTVYAEHAARAFRLHLWTDAQWAAREAALRAPDLFAKSAPISPSHSSPVGAQRHPAENLALDRFSRPPPATVSFEQ
jgi:phage terminase large subunit GpA-like protein